MLDSTKIIQANIDELATGFDYHLDVAEDFAEIKQALDERISAYGRGSNDYGSLIMQPHLLRTSILAKAFLIDNFGLNETTAENIFQANLYHDLGKTHDSFAPHIWTFRDRAPDHIKQETIWHTAKGLEVTDSIAAKFNKSSKSVDQFLTLIKSLQNYHHEQFNGQGRHTVPGSALGQIMQVICMFDAYDGDLIKRYHQKEIRTPELELYRLQNERKYQGAFDPELIKMLVAYKDRLLAFEAQFAQDDSTRREDLPMNSIEFEKSLGLA